jgi:AraC-like DNA-binding protein
VLQKGSALADLASLLSSFDEMIACEQVDAILKRAVELARERVGLRRVAIFLRDESQGLMRGTWGTDLDGATVDEHALTFETWQGDREFYEQAARDGVYWTVIENAPIVVHLPAETRVVGRGWVCCTPVRSGRELIGMMFNDAGLTGERLDEAKQTKGAVLSSLLGSVLEVARRRGLVYECALPVARSSVVMKAVQLLAEEPSLSSEELGAKLQLSASRVARVFKAEMGISLVDYRNRLRLERFNALLSEPGSNLLEAALQAGFGSYAQFHRVFMASRGTTPGRFARLRAQREK